MSSDSSQRSSSPLRASRAFSRLVRRAGLTGLGLGILLTPALLWPMVASADPPIAIDDTVTVAEDASPTTVDVLANDETSDNLTFVSTTDPAHGTVIVAANGLSLTYEPDADYNGPDTFDYTVKDGSDVQATASVDVTVTPVNDPPVALDDPGIPCGNLAHIGGSYPIAEDWIGFFDDYPGWFVLFGGCGLLGNDTDVDGDSLDWEIVSQPFHGEAMYVEPLFFAYKPDPDWSTLPGDQPGGDWVSDSFTYRAFDGIAYSDPATMRFWLVPINDPPTFTPGPAYIWSDEDVEYEAQWATAISTGPANESHQSITFEIVEFTNEDLFSVAPVIDADGVLSFTPTPDATGHAELTVRAKDDGGLGDYGFGGDDFVQPDDSSAEYSFEIDILDVNDAPVASTVAAEVDEDGTAWISLTGDYTDIENDSVSLEAISQPAHGSAQLDGSGALYVPDLDFNGTDSFTYTIDDGNGGHDTGTAQVTVNPINDDPVADDDVATLSEDALATLIPVLVGDTDVDGDVLHVTGVTNGSKGTVTITGTRLAVRYKPFRNAYGTDTFTYFIEDADGHSTSASVEVTITPVNDPPNAVNDGRPTPIHIQQGRGAINLDVMANDNSGPDEPELLTIVSVTQPAHGLVVIDGGAWSVTYDPAGQYAGLDQFTYTISDGNGGTDSATVFISVGPAITAPVASAPRVVVGGGSTGTTVQASVVWSATSETSISRYQLQYQADGGAWMTVALPTPTSTRAVVTLTAGHDYWFRVRAADGAGIFGAYAKSRVIHL